MRKSFFLILFLITLNISLIPTNKNCYTIIAGKNATVDGSVIIAHNEDDQGTLFVNVHKIHSILHKKNELIKLKNNGNITQVRKTSGFLWLEIPGKDFSDSYFTENGIVITSNACLSKEDKGDITQGGIGFMLRRIIAERAKSARDAVVIAGKLIEKYGYYSSGRTLCVADSNEGWILHVIMGKHWVAKKVPDNHIAVISNRFTINKISPEDKKRFLCSPDIIEYSITRGWFDLKKEGIIDFSKYYKSPKELKNITKILKQWEFEDLENKFDFTEINSSKGNFKAMKNILKKWRNKSLQKKFNFSEIYSNPDNYKSMGNILRQWRGINLLSEENYTIDKPLPFSFIPQKKVRVRDLFKVLRDHFENTKYDLSNNYRNGSPNSTKNRTICTRTTQYSFVAKLRNGMPQEIKDVVWIAFRRPDSNAYTPWYFFTNSTPSGYTYGNSKNAINNHFKKASVFLKSNTSYAFWGFAKLSELVDQDYKNRIKLVRKEWRNFENYSIKNLKKKEKEFLYLFKKNKNIALKIITNHIHNLEYRKWFLTTELIKTMEK